MPKYLISGSYVGEGIKGLLKDGGTKRKEAVEQLIGSLGGTVESVHFAFGDDDFFIIVDAPDKVFVEHLPDNLGYQGAYGNSFLRRDDYCYAYGFCGAGVVLLG